MEGTRQFFRNAGIMALVDGLCLLQYVVVLAILTRRYGPVDFGAWSQIGVLTAFLAPVVMLGTDAAAVRILPALTPTQRRRYFSAWFILVLGVALLAAALLVAARHWLAAWFWASDAEFTQFVPWAGAALVVSVLLGGPLKNWFRIQSRPVMFSLATSGRFFINLAAVLICCVLDRGILTFVMVSVSGQALFDLGLVIVVVVSGGCGRPDFSGARRLVAFGIVLVPSGFAMTGLNYIDRLFIIRSGGLADIGVYAFAYSVGYMVIQSLVNPIWNMYANTVAKLHDNGRDDEIQTLFSLSVTVIMALSLPVIAAVHALHKQLVEMVAGPRFAAAGSLIVVVTAGYLCHLLATYFDTSLGLVYRQRYATISLVVAATVNIVLNALLIPVFGLAGAAWATAASFGLQFILSYAFARRHRRLRLPVAAILRVGSAAVAAGFCIRWAANWLPDTVSAMILALAAGALVYLGLVWWAGVLRPRAVIAFWSGSDRDAP